MTINNHIINYNLRFNIIINFIYITSTLCLYIYNDTLFIN